MRALVVTLLVVGLLALGAHTGVEASTWPGCDRFDTQRQAQDYWEAHGRPAEADGDGDGDGRVCESLPTGGGSPDDCSRPRKPVTVRLSRRRYPESTLHFAIAWKQGAPRRYTIARGLADENRDAWQPRAAACDRAGSGNVGFAALS